MVEFTRLINKNKFLSLISTNFIKLFFLIIRTIVKPLSFRNGGITVIALHKLGDTVFTIPAILALQDSYRNKITILCYPESIDIYRLAINNLNFCAIEKDKFYFNNRIASHRARKMLNAIKPKVIFDLTGVMTSATLIFNSRAKEINGINRKQFSTIYDNYIELRKTPHLMDIYIDIVSLKIQEIDRNRLKTFPKNINESGKIIIHPLAGWKAKEWNLLKFIQLAEILNKNYRVSLIAPYSNKFYDMLSELKKKEVEFIQTKSINDLIEIIRECSIFIGNDSGPLNIAALLGKPTFAIYGPTNPAFHLPAGNYHDYIRKEIQCTPVENDKYCFTNGGRNCPSFECIEQLSLDLVLNKLESFLSKLNIQKNK